MNQQPAWSAWQLLRPRDGGGRGSRRSAIFLTIEARSGALSVPAAAERAVFIVFSSTHVYDLVVGTNPAWSPGMGDHKGMTVMLKLSVGLVLGVSLSACAADPAEPGGSDAPQQAPQVIDGAATVDDLGFPINHLERNAVLGQVALLGSTVYQGCSGTLVGDRLVITAGHCVMTNFDDWANGEDPAIVSPPEREQFVVGDDVYAPACLLTAESIHLHPDMTLGTTTIDHDAALIVLQESVWETCAAAIPIQLNREPLDEQLVGEVVLQGGFGSVDGTYDFSPLRYWSLVGVEAVEAEQVVVQEIGQGIPTYGDSGSGVLKRFADGTLRILGIFSTSMGGHMRFVRTDTQTALLDAVVDETLMCGAVDELGACRDNVAVSCDTQGFRSTDCTEMNEECLVDDDGVASCTCPCDTEPFCQLDCVCDVQCPCECDVSEGCDADCACDAPCYDPPPAAEGDTEEEGGCTMAAGGAGAGDRSAPLWLMMAVLCWATRRFRSLSATL